MPIAKGRFEVKLNTLETSADGEAAGLGRRGIDKQFFGDLNGTSRGEMLMSLSPVQGSAGYVAIEMVQGHLHGQSGSFVLQHVGMMDRGAQQQRIEVIPDSGREELEGLRGSFRIVIENGEHFYEFDWQLPEP